MIPSTRFVETSDNREAWLAARMHGVTATAVAKASTPAGFAEVLEQRLNPVEILDNDYMAFGREQEPIIARWAKDTNGIMPNSWLIASEVEPLFMATPDGLALDHMTIGEYKTTGKEDWSTIPIQYRRQVQWQLFCTGATSCLFAWQLRVPDASGWFYPGWLEPDWVVMDRDEAMIANLRVTADLLIQESETRKAA